MKLFVTLKKTKTLNQIGNICLTDEAVDHEILYFHQPFNHPGYKRLLNGVSRYFHPKLRQKLKISIAAPVKNSKLTVEVMDYCPHASESKWSWT